MSILEKSILYILEHQPDNEIAILRLAKYLYLSDYIYAKTFGDTKSFTGTYSRYKNGPVPVKFYEALDKLYSAGMAVRVGNTIKLNQTIQLNGFSEKEKACMEKVMADFARKSLSKVLEAAYSTEPMVEIIEQEQSIGETLFWKTIDFHKIEKHPLMNLNDVDTSFLDSEEYKSSIDE